MHELFHALYQRRFMYRLPERDLERWAAYTQYRYKYRGRSNWAIGQTLRDELRIGEFEIERFSNDAPRNSRLTAFEAEQKYAVFALPLFQRRHEVNVDDYANIMAHPPRRKKQPGAVSMKEKVTNALGRIVGQ